MSTSSMRCLVSWAAMTEGASSVGDLPTACVRASCVFVSHPLAHTDPHTLRLDNLETHYLRPLRA